MIQPCHSVCGGLCGGSWSFGPAFFWTPENGLCWPSSAHPNQTPPHHCSGPAPDALRHAPPTPGSQCAWVVRQTSPQASAHPQMRPTPAQRHRRDGAVLMPTSTRHRTTMQSSLATPTIALFHPFPSLASSLPGWAWGEQFKWRIPRQGPPPGHPPPPPPLCDIPSNCCFFTGPWTVTRSSLRMLRRVAAF